MQIKTFCIMLIISCAFCIATATVSGSGEISEEKRASTIIYNSTEKHDTSMWYLKTGVGSSAWGVFAYGLTGANQELMNECNWCWPHHRNEVGLCVVELNSLAKFLGFVTAGTTLGLRFILCKWPIYNVYLYAKEWISQVHQYSLVSILLIPLLVLFFAYKIIFQRKSSQVSAIAGCCKKAT